MGTYPRHADRLTVMPLQLFLNELSSSVEEIDRSKAIEYLKGLTTVLRSVKKIDPNLFLNSEIPLNQFSLGSKFNVATLRNSPECAEERIYLKAIYNRAPLSHVIKENQHIDSQEFDYKISKLSQAYAGEPAVGLGLAHRLEGLGLSVPSHLLWRSSLIELDLLELMENGDVSHKEVHARNVCDLSCLKHHEEALRTLLNPKVSSGYDLWNNREILFPNIRFIPRTEKQIVSILEGNPMLKQLKIKLSGIDKAVAEWSANIVPHPVYPFNVRPESSTRIKYTKFKDNSGIERTFSDHADLAPTEARIHFLLLTDPCKIALIGHVGRKLHIG